MNFSDVIKALTADCSGYAAAKKLGITPSTFYKYKNGQKTPGDEVLDRMVEISGLSVREVYLAAYAEKLNNPDAAALFRDLAVH